MTDTKLIAITGGIGAGKSIVSRCLCAMGFDVYDSDSRAKQLMDSSEVIKEELAVRISESVIRSDGSIDRKELAGIVFADPLKLEILNSIVHSYVREDVGKFRICSPKKFAFVETAILYQSRLDLMVDQVWDVVAPEELRVERVMKRSNMTAEEVRARIKSQEFIPETPHSSVFEIINDEVLPLLPRIEELLG